MGDLKMRAVRMDDEMWDAIPGVKNEFIREWVAKGLATLKDRESNEEEKIPLLAWIDKVEKGEGLRRQPPPHPQTHSPEQIEEFQALRSIYGADAVDGDELLLQCGEPDLPTPRFRSRFLKDLKIIGRWRKKGLDLSELLQTMRMELEQGTYETARKL